MLSLSRFDVSGRPGNLHSPMPRLPLHWLKQRRIALPTECSVELCCSVKSDFAFGPPNAAAYLLTLS